MIFLQPAWFLLALPLAASFIIWRLPSRLITVLRIAALIPLLVAMASPIVLIPRQAGTVIAVVDRSRSLPQDHDHVEREIIDLVQKSMGTNDRLGVVAFGERAAIERPPDSGRFSGFLQEVGGEASNMADGIDRALSLIPRGAPGRILLVSDCRWTGRDPSGEAFRAAARGVPIDVRTLERPGADDQAIEAFDAPVVVTPGEAFLLTAWIRVPVGRDVSYTLSRGSTVISRGHHEFPPGVSRLPFRDMADPKLESGVFDYRLEIDIPAGDPRPENNVARALTAVRGPRPLLVVSESPGNRFAEALRGAGLRVRLAKPSEMTWSLEELAACSAVLLENVPAEAIGMSGMNTLAAWVRELGGGLMITGGKNSYALGGYFRSPLEGILPVSMELRSEHRKLALAIVVVMDRSGSMAIDAGNGRRKMDLANLAAAEVLNMLGPLDEFGVVAVDSAPHIVAPLAPVENKSRVRSDILRIQSEGGGIFIEVALTAALAELAKAKAGTRHLILFADAQDSEEPGRYKEIVDAAHKANMTISVVGMGLPGDRDSDLLRDIAKRGAGRIFFSEKVDDLPRLFVQDTFVVARNTFIDAKTVVERSSGLFELTGLSGSTGAGSGFAEGAFPAVGGYNLCYLRPGATQGLVSRDEYKAPLLAWWNAGIGRTLCYTGEIDGIYSGDFATWPGAPSFLSAAARWAGGRDESVDPGSLITQEIIRGSLVVKLHLDPERWKDPFSDPPVVTILRAMPGCSPNTETRTMSWTAPDELAADIPLRGEETALATVGMPGKQVVRLAPAVLPYSPEYRPTTTGDGIRARESLMKASGGIERLDLGGIWKDLPRTPFPVRAAPAFLALALLMFLLEVAERRTGLLSFAFARLSFFRSVYSWVHSQFASSGPSFSGSPHSASIASSNSSSSTNSSHSSQNLSPPLSPSQTSASASSSSESVASGKEPGQASGVAPADQKGLLDALKKARRRIDHGK
ncbi:MAG: VWA domain-containing protein [Candidatus Riflebacteria bacterium]|nr:VWA domain-containing protein [Candidatus Riflebacteria bacterium]